MKRTELGSHTWWEHVHRHLDDLARARREAERAPKVDPERAASTVERILTSPEGT